MFIDDDIIRLQARVERLKSRHGLENILGLAPGASLQCTVKRLQGNEILVTSSFLVCRFRIGDTSPYVGWYEHRLKQLDGELKIHHKRAVLDMEALREHGAVSIIL